MVGPLAESGRSTYLSTLTPMGAMAGILGYGTPGVPGRASRRAASVAPDHDSAATAIRLALASARKTYRRVCGIKGFIERSFLGAPQSDCSPPRTLRSPRAHALLQFADPLRCRRFRAASFGHS